MTVISTVTECADADSAAVQCSRIAFRRQARACKHCLATVDTLSKRLAVVATSCCALLLRRSTGKSDCRDVRRSLKMRLNLGQDLRRFFLCYHSLRACKLREQSVALEPRHYVEVQVKDNLTSGRTSVV